MRNYSSLGRAGQVKHPRIRGRLPANRRDERRGHEPNMADIAQLSDYSQPIEDSYFVPSFSIRRHLHKSEELLWDTNQRLVQRRLGRGYRATLASQISLKTIEQKRLIHNMRQAEIHPDPEQVRDVAYHIRDLLTDLLSSARSPMSVPLGELGKFGNGNKAIAYTIAGWRGDRAHYDDENDAEGYMDTRAVILEERRLSVGALALAFGEAGLDTDSLAPCPHIRIARSKDEIADYRMRGIRGELADLAIDDAYFGDPVIDLKMYRDEPAESIYVKHAWDSLAVTA